MGRTQRQIAAWWDKSENLFRLSAQITFDDGASRFRRSLRAIARPWTFHLSFSSLPSEWKRVTMRPFEDEAGRVFDWDIKWSIILCLTFGGHCHRRLSCGILQTKAALRTNEASCLFLTSLITASFNISAFAVNYFNLPSRRRRGAEDEWKIMRILVEERKNDFLARRVKVKTFSPLFLDHGQGFAT